VARRELARWLARFGGKRVADQVRRELEAGMKDVESAACERCHWQAVLAAIEAYVRIGKAEQARDFATRWDAHHPNAHRWYSFQRQQSEALLMAASGDARSALQHFQAARRDAEQMGASLEALWVQIDLGEALASVDTQRAIATLQAAAAEAETIGTGSAHQRADEALRGLGVRTWRRTADARDVLWPVLTAREREVLRFVTEGASNPEIASATFLSRKTVERHISNISRKVGVRNRTELAAAVGRETEGVPR
jgi:DNA-binding CsgD family transcriptional regulator